MRSFDELMGRDDPAAEIKSKQELEALKAKDDLRKVLGSEAGKNVLAHYIQVAGVFDFTFVHSGSQSYFKQGEKSLGGRILAEAMNAHPEAALAMMKAHFGEKVKDE